MGVNRSINDERSGRSFLQDWAMSDESSIGVGHFFETLKSSRRLQLIEEVNTTLAGSMPSHPDSLIDTLEELGESTFTLATAITMPPESTMRRSKVSAVRSGIFTR